MTSTKKNPAFTVVQHSRNVHVVQLDAGNDWRTWEHFCLLSSDRHHDSVHANWDLERKHLDEVLKRGASWLDCGDLFDAMSGRFDPRSNKGDIRPEYNVPNYWDAIVRDAAEFYSPYASNLICIGRGNHETSVLRRTEIDLTEQLCAQMAARVGYPVYSGGYGGYVRFAVKLLNTEQRVFDIRYYHGSGGGGPMTHGVLSTRRMASWCNADCIITGHTHDHWHVRLQREILTANKGKYAIQLKDQHHVKTPSYKDEHKDGFIGWHVETGKPPKPTGATWMRLSLVEGTNEGDTRRQSRARLVAQFMEAT